MGSKQLGDKSYNAFAPKALDKIDETWTVQIVVPKSKVLETYNQILVFTIVAAIPIIILIVVVNQLKLAQ
ncbi:hypothetical protein FOH38_08315 [Lysinibacillus fusiformis]|nr:hypothetical protein FOH38_08315 [Lysinibacillus fusiformis]